MCLKQLEDVQLAFAITRIYEGDDSELLKEIVMLHVLPRALATQDRWSASMAFSLLGDREKAILSLLIPLDILNEDKPCPPVTKELLAALNDPALLVGYVFLKRQYASVRYFPDVPQDVETEFIYQTVAAYERIGCPGLALSILQQFDDWLPQPDISLLDEESRSRSPSADRFMTSTIPRRGSFALDSGLSDWGALSAVSKAAGQFRRGSKTSDDLNESPGSRRKSQVSLDYFDKHEVQRSETGTLLTVPTLGVPEKERAEDFDWSQPIVRNQVEDTYVSTLLLDEPDLEETIEIPLQGEPGSVSVSKALGSEAKAPAMDRKTAFTFLMENKNSRLFQWFLGMRLVQAATTSTTNVCDNLDVLKDDPLFAAFFDRMQEGLHGMSEAIGMPLDVLDRVINLRCREADVFRAYIELLPLYGDLESYTEKLSLFMVQECNTVARLAFEVAREALPQVFVEFIASFSRRLLASLNRWQEKSSSSSHDATAQSFIPQVAVTAFVALVLCANVMRDFSLVNQLVQSSTGFFNALRSRDFPALYSVIGAVLSGDFVPDTPDASYEHESDTEFDDVTAEFKPKTKTADNITADNLVFYAALTQTAHKLGDFLLVLEESGSGGHFLPVPRGRISRPFLCRYSLQFCARWLASPTIHAAISTADFAPDLSAFHSKRRTADARPSHCTVPWTRTTSSMERNIQSFGY